LWINKVSVCREKGELGTLNKTHIHLQIIYNIFFVWAGESLTHIIGHCVHSPPDSQLQGRDLLLYLVKCEHQPRVLIDVGALLVSLTNKEVAEIWLDHSDPSISGAVSLAIIYLKNKLTFDSFGRYFLTRTTA
jgi:hypothetical protein